MTPAVGSVGCCGRLVRGARGPEESERRMNWKRAVVIVMMLAGVLAACGCRDKDHEKGREVITLCTTTSVESSGLLEVLLAAFTDETGIEVRVVSVGTGKALRLGRDGNCDAVLVHAPKAEERFVRDGWGVQRRQIMYNDFIIAGPGGDPAGIGGADSAPEALKRIAEAEAVFVSRGDKSGTHMKEMQLWKAATVSPAGQWYRSVGKGMGGTLTMAGEMGAYVLTDRATFIRFGGAGKLGLKVLLEGAPLLHNPYGVMAVNPKKHPYVQYEKAMKFIEFISSEQGRKIIGGYRIDGQVLFHPLARKKVRP